MKPSKLLTAVLLFLVIAVNTSCKKSDSAPPPTANSQEKFFSITADAPAEIKAINNAIKRQNEKRHFINSLVKRIGYPQWANAIMSTASASRISRGSAGSDYDFVYIPFVRDSEKYVNSSLVVRYNATDTVYKLLYAEQYRNFGFDSSATRWTAKDVFNLFVRFDNSVFGHTSFIVTDGRLAGADSSQKLRATISKPTARSNQRTSDWVSAEICSNYTFCIIVGATQRSKNNQRTEIYPVDESCWSKAICTYSTFYVDNSVGGGSGGDGSSVGTIDGSGGTGGTGSTSGTSGSTDPTQYSDPSWWDYNACGSLDYQNVSCVQQPIGWFPVSERDPDGFLYSRIDELMQDLQSDKNFLVPCDYLQNPNFLPCDYLTQFQYMSTFTPPAEITNRLSQLMNDYEQNNVQQMFPSVVFPSSYPFYLQTLAAASGATVNMDYFPIHITQMPTVNGVQLTPSQLFDYFRKHIDEFLDQSIAKFQPYNDGYTDDTQLWNSSNPFTAMLHLDMAKDGSVIVSQYQDNPSNSDFLVSTLETPLDNNHPLGGNRRWGIEPDSRNGGYLFYTTAVDRIFTDWLEFGDWVKKRLTGTSGFEDADRLWRTLQDKMITYIVNNGGQASKYAGNEVIARPNWDDVKDFLNGTITVSEMRTKMGCN